MRPATRRHATGGERELAYRYASSRRSRKARYAYTEALSWLDLAATSRGAPSRPRR